MTFRKKTGSSLLRSRSDHHLKPNFDEATKSYYNKSKILLALGKEEGAMDQFERFRTLTERKRDMLLASGKISEAVELVREYIVLLEETAFEIIGPKIPASRLRLLSEKAKQEDEKYNHGTKTLDKKQGSPLNQNEYGRMLRETNLSDEVLAQLRRNSENN